MKNVFKKFAAYLFSAAILSSAAVMPSQAAENIREAEFDTAAFTLSYNPDNGKFSERVLDDTDIRIVGLSNQLISADESVRWGEKTLDLVQSPFSQNNTNRALQITLNENTQKDTLQIFSYIDGEADGAWGRKQVYEYKVMFDAQCNNYMWFIQGTDNKELRLLQFQHHGDDKMLIYSYYDKKQKIIDCNKWYTIQTVADFTNKDQAKDSVQVYIDGEQFIDGKIASFGRWNPGEQPKLCKFAINTSDKTKPERHMYLDDWKIYTYTDDDETQIALPDYSNRAFISGKTINLSAASYVGGDGIPVNKVEYYRGDTKLGESTTIPYEFAYMPEGSGFYTITAKAYTAMDSSIPCAEAETSFLVEPEFREEILMKEDFETYVDGTTNWNDAVSGRWQTFNCVPEGVRVDAAHGTSLSLGAREDGNRELRAIQDIREGTIKISGEYYFNTVGNNNTMMIFNNGSSDINSMRVHGAMELLDVRNGNAVLEKLTTKRWYKIDLITTIKDGQGYYTIYIDGERVVRNAYQNPASISMTNRVAFLSAANDAEVYLDNLSISKITYFDNTGFFSDGINIDNLQSMMGSVLTAKTGMPNGLEDRQIMAVYNKDTNQLKEVVFGTYDERTNVSTASYDLGPDKNVTVKVFVWDGMTPKTDTPAVIE